jgi:hypothetical protein
MKKDIFYVVYKKINFGAKIDVARDIFCLVHKIKKIVGFP